MQLDAGLLILIGLALLFDFLNGFHDSANLVATVIASRALAPRRALLLAAAANFSGPFLFGVAVATTVGDDLLDSSVIQPPAVTAALVAAISWNVLTWYVGIPSSSSHALIGGLLGATVLTGGLSVIRVMGLAKVLAALFLSPILGLLVGIFVMRATLFLFRSARPRVNVTFRRVQVLTLIGLGLSHGANDAQKTMGVITLGLVTAGHLSSFRVPLWVVVISAGAMAIGTSIGGWRLIHTLGHKIFRIRPVHGFTSQLSSSAIILGAAVLGGPVSTTQVMSSAIIGVGAAQRPKMVRWQVLREMMVAWLLTLPVTALIAGVIALILPN